MTSVPGGSDRKIRQLDDDVHAIYEIVGGLTREQARQGRRQDEVEARLMGRMDALEAGITGLAGRLDVHDARFDAVDSRLDAVDSRLDAVDSRLGSIDSRLDAVDSRLDAVDSRVGSIDSRLGSIQTSMAEVLRRLPETG